MKNMAVSSRYADAIYEEAQAQGVLDAVYADLRQLDNLLNSNKEFSMFTKTAALTSGEKLAVIDKIGAKMQRLAHGLLVVLTRNHRLMLLASVIAAMKNRMIIEKGEVEVDVHYAAEVTDSIRKELSARLAELTNKKVILNEKVEPALLGGMRVYIGSTLYDFSVRGKLDALKTEFAK